MNKLTLPYPISVNRYWRTARGITYISAEGKKFKTSVQKEYQWAVRPKDGNVAVNIVIHPKLTIKGAGYKTIIDLDNSLKCILDSLIGIVYLDDKQVKQISLSYGNAVLNGAAVVNFSFM